MKPILLFSYLEHRGEVVLGIGIVLQRRECVKPDRLCFVHIHCFSTLKQKICTVNAPNLVAAVLLINVAYSIELPQSVLSLGVALVSSHAIPFDGLLNTLTLSIFAVLQKKRKYTQINV